MMDGLSLYEDSNGEKASSKQQNTGIDARFYMYTCITMFYIITAGLNRTGLNKLVTPTAHNLI